MYYEILSELSHLKKKKEYLSRQLENAEPDFLEISNVDSVFELTIEDQMSLSDLIHSLELQLAFVEEQIEALETELYEHDPDDGIVEGELDDFGESDTDGFVW